MKRARADAKKEIDAARRRLSRGDVMGVLRNLEPVTPDLTGQYRAKKYDALRAWCEDEGAVLHPALELRWSEQRGGHAVARNQVEADSTLLQLPGHLLLSFTAASAGVSRHHSPKVLRQLTSLDRDMSRDPEAPAFARSRVQRHRVLTYVLLMAERCKEDSFWKPYLDLLAPSWAPEQVGSVIARVARNLAGCCPRSEDSAFAAQFAGTHVESLVNEDWRTIRQVYTYLLRDQLCLRNPDVFPPEQFSLDLVVWAFAIFHSRAMDVPLPPGALKGFVSPDRAEALVPLADLFNHRPGALMRFTTSKALTATSSQSLSSSSSSRHGGAIEGVPCVFLVNGSSVPGPRAAGAAAGGSSECSEVSISYGPLGNGELSWPPSFRPPLLLLPPLWLLP